MEPIAVDQECGNSEEGEADAEEGKEQDEEWANGVTLRGREVDAPTVGPTVVDSCE